MKRILVTGGAGFIGSHLIKKLLISFSDYKIFNIDNLTYAGKKNNLLNLSNKKNYKFIQEDICDYKKVCDVFKTFDITDVIHLAAESHVDRSIENSQIFGKTNVLGTISLLEAAKNYWKFPYKNNLFYHISTDEVYGSLGKSGKFSEITKKVVVKRVVD